MCGIFGAFGVRKAAELTAIGLHAIQHRAIDFAGIASSNGRSIYIEKGEGVARKAFTYEMLNRAHGMNALGHIRYPTLEDDKTLDNIQPIRGNYCGADFALVHNGNLTNHEELKQRVGGRVTSLDTESIVRMLEERASGSIEEGLRRVLPDLKGSFALGILLPDSLIAANDPRENRPLCIGRNNGSYFLSSETVGLAAVEAEFVCDVPAGTIITIDKNGMRKTPYAKPALKRCPFEGIYFSHPSSEVYGIPVTGFRLRLGEALEKACPAVGADYVMGIPDSGTFHAMGYAKSGRSGAYMPGIIRNHYVGRTFIAAAQAKRDEEVTAKFGFTRSLIEGKKIVVIDDSVVRGTTLPKIIRVLRWLGAAEIHVRIACPLIRHLCRYGIYMKGKDGRLIANEKTVEEIRAMSGADSLCFLPLKVLRSVWPEPDDSCFACMDGRFWD